MRPIQSGLRKNSRRVDGRPHFLLIVGVGDIVDAAKSSLVGGAARAEDPNLGGLGTGSDRRDRQRGRVRFQLQVAWSRDTDEWRERRDHLRLFDWMLGLPHNESRSHHFGLLGFLHGLEREEGGGRTSEKMSDPSLAEHHLSFLAITFVVRGDVGDVSEAEVRGESVGRLLGRGSVDLSWRIDFDWIAPSSTGVSLRQVRVGLGECPVVISGESFFGRRGIPEAIGGDHFLLAAHLLDDLSLVLIDVGLPFV
jgi:hypothetical protein